MYQDSFSDSVNKSCDDCDDSLSLKSILGPTKNKPLLAK